MRKILVLTDAFEKWRRFFFQQTILINAKTNDEIKRPGSALGPFSDINGCGRQIADLCLASIGSLGIRDQCAEPGLLKRPCPQVTLKDHRPILARFQG